MLMIESCMIVLSDVDDRVRSDSDGRVTWGGYD